MHNHLDKTYDDYKKAHQHKCSQVFEVGDLVMVHLHKNKLPRGTRMKLHLRNIGLYPIMETFGDNAYKVDLPPSY